MRKTSVTIGLVAALGMVILARPAPAQPSFSVSVRLGDFYDELSPYGEWVDCRYGDCWVPRGVGAGWQPYSNGEWIYTRYGWTWVSSDPWGGDPYHYGTWDFVDRYGWVWVPGTVWAPAWVTWSYSDRYVGWAPMPPTVMFGSAGYSGRPVIVSQSQYVFVPTNRFVGSNVMSVRVEPRQNGEIFRQVKHVTRFEVSGGILRNAAVPLATVQRSMSTRIETREIGSAHTTPRTISSSGVGTRGKVAIISAARDMRAARAARQKTAPEAATPQRPQPQAMPKQPAKPMHETRPVQQARPPQEARPQRQEARPPQAVTPQRQEVRPPQAVTPQRQEARPPQAAKPQREARPPQAAGPQRHEARPGPQAGPQREAKPAAKEDAKSENKGKKDPPGKDGRPD